MSERYSFSLTTFSPSGKLAQIEYALNAVTRGGQTVGIKTNGCVVLACDKKQKNDLYDEGTIRVVQQITPHIGMAYSGLGPDYRLLVKNARKIAEQYKMVYNEEIPTLQLTQKVASVMQEYTQTGGVRPFGVSVLIAGFDVEQQKSMLYQCDPSGAYFAWKASALGHNHTNAKTFLEKRYSTDLGIDDVIHTSILTLKEGFEGQMTENNIEIGVGTKGGFVLLKPSEVADALATVTH